MNYIFGGIDGTGTSNNAVYEKEFKDSFVRQLFRGEPSFVGGISWRHSYYVRGPVNHGFDTDDKMRLMKKTLAQHLNDVKKGRKKLVLAGYSRGAAAVTALCNELGVDVHLLVLFDAVSMTDTVKADVVPANVKNCLHVIRDPATFSRHTWGNCAKRVADKKATNYLPIVRFKCTHGGMGGVPWPKPDDKKWDDLIDESYYNRNGIIARGSRLHPLTGPAQGLYEKAAWTKVSYRNDHSYSANVKVWMSRNIQSILHQDALVS